MLQTSALSSAVLATTISRVSFGESCAREEHRLQLVKIDLWLPIHLFHTHSYNDRLRLPIWTPPQSGYIQGGWWAQLVKDGTKQNAHHTHPHSHTSSFYPQHWPILRRFWKIHFCPRLMHSIVITISSKRSSVSTHGRMEKRWKKKWTRSNTWDPRKPKMEDQ